MIETSAERAERFGYDRDESIVSVEEELIRFEAWEDRKDDLCNLSGSGRARKILIDLSDTLARGMSKTKPLSNGVLVTDLPSLSHRLRTYDQ